MLATCDAQLVARLRELLGAEASEPRAALAARLRALAEQLESESPPVDSPPPPPQPEAAAEPAAEQEEEAAAGKRPRPQGFDAANYPTRLVALELFYAGWNYHGFATQGEGPSCSETVETHLFAALRVTRLVPARASWGSVEYSRCGRTDRGVSALRQVVVVRLRCARPGEGAAGGEELDYVGALNRALPADIRVLSWRPAPAAFSARFNASWRQYKYFFWDDGGLDLEAMRRGAALLVGQHDFRNLCKMDVDCVSNFVRVIHTFTLQREDGAQNAAVGSGEGIASSGGGGGGGGLTLWSLNVRGSAFLWHQVRCMASVLLLIGRGLEQPSVITQLLDVAAMPGKPAYDMASEQPLLFFDCGHDRPGAEALTLPHLPAPTPKRTLQLLVAHLAGETRRAAVRAQMFGYAMRRAEEVLAQRGEDGMPEKVRGKHVPLLQRHREASFEVQLARRPAGKVKNRPTEPSAAEDDE